MNDEMSAAEEPPEALPDIMDGGFGITIQRGQAALPEEDEEGA